MRPASGRISPARHWRVNVLPAPDGPKSPTTDFSARQLTSSVNPGYLLTISTETTASSEAAQIGRASCREREQVPVGGGALRERSLAGEGVAAPSAGTLCKLA